MYWVYVLICCFLQISDGDVHTTAYAEIIVIRHGETEWNALSKIQVYYTLLPYLPFFSCFFYTTTSYYWTSHNFDNNI